MASQAWLLLSDVRWLWRSVVACIIRRSATDNRSHGEPSTAVIIRRDMAAIRSQGYDYQTLPLEQPLEQPSPVSFDRAASLQAAYAYFRRDIIGRCGIGTVLISIAPNARCQIKSRL